MCVCVCVCVGGWGSGKGNGEGEGKCQGKDYGRCEREKLQTQLKAVQTKLDLFLSLEVGPYSSP